MRDLFLRCSSARRRHTSAERLRHHLLTVCADSDAFLSHPGAFGPIWPYSICMQVGRCLLQREGPIRSKIGPQWPVRGSVLS